MVLEADGRLRLPMPPSILVATEDALRLVELARHLLHLVDPASAVSSKYRAYIDW
jgi:hypothetical protein